MNLDDLLKSIREEDDSKGAKIDTEKFLKRKTFTNPLKGQRYQAPGLPSAPPVVVKPTIKIVPDNVDIVGEEFGDKLDELIQVIREDNKLEEKDQKEDKKQLEAKKKKDREDRIETKKETKSFIIDLKKSTGKFSGFFDNLKKFFKTVLLGGLINTLYNFFTDPKNKDKIEATQKFLKNYWPAVLGALAYFFTPFGTLVNFVVGTVGKFLLKLGLLVAKNPILAAALAGAAGAAASAMRNEDIREQLDKEDDDSVVTPKEFLEENQRPGAFQLYDEVIRQRGFGQFFSGGGLSMGTDTVPAMLTPGEFIMSRGAVNMFGADTLMAMNKAGGGTNIPKFGLVSGYQGGGFVISREQQALLDAISFAEGTKKSYGTIYGGKVVPELEQGKLTLDQVHEMMMTGKLNGKSVGYGRGKYASVATGRYQLMPDTLRDIQRNMRLSGDTLLTPDMQDKMILDRVTHFRGVSPEMLKKEGLSTRVLDRLAPEFASFPFAPKNNQSYYGQPVKSPESIREAYKKSLNIQKTPPAQPAPPPVIPAGPSFGPGFDSNERAQSERLNLINLMYANRAKQSTNRFSGVDLDFIFKPIRQFLGIDTPNAPTSTKIIVLPAVKQTAQQSGTQVKEEIPNFKISSGVKMRGLVGKALGIEDLVS